MGLCAGTFAAEPLWVAAAAFVVIGLGALAWALVGAQGIEATRTVDHRTVVEGDRVEVRVLVAAGVAGRLPSGTIADDLLESPVALHLGAPRQALRIRTTFARRGRRRLEPVRVAVGDPLGLARRTVVSSDDLEVLVLPRIVPVTTPGGQGDGDVLRPRAGRPPRWRSTACARTARAPRPRASTGRAGRARGSSWSAASSPTPTRARSWSSTRATPRTRTPWTPPCAPRRRWPSTSRAPVAARCCCRGTAARPRWTRPWPGGIACTCASRWSRAARGRASPAWPASPVPGALRLRAPHARAPARAGRRGRRRPHARGPRHARRASRVLRRGGLLGL